MVDNYAYFRTEGKDLVARFARCYRILDIQKDEHLKCQSCFLSVVEGEGLAISLLGLCHHFFNNSEF
jgi:hypothetical protein